MKRQYQNLIRRFSLIELLLVISIIAILSSILLPALNQAKNTAKSIQCRGNLKSLTQGLLMYVNDWNGYFPHRPPAENTYDCWDWQICSYVNYKPNRTGPAVFYCPSSKPSPYLPQLAASRSYAMNGDLAGDNYNSSYERPLKITGIARIANAFALVDMKWSDATYKDISQLTLNNRWNGEYIQLLYLFNATMGPKMMGFRHQVMRGINFSNIDGSVHNTRRGNGRGVDIIYAVSKSAGNSIYYKDGILYNK